MMKSNPVNAGWCEFKHPHVHWFQWFLYIYTMCAWSCTYKVRWSHPFGVPLQAHNKRVMLYFYMAWRCNMHTSSYHMHALFGVIPPLLLWPAGWLTKIWAWRSPTSPRREKKLPRAARAPRARRVLVVRSHPKVKRVSLWRRQKFPGNLSLQRLPPRQPLSPQSQLVLLEKWEGKRPSRPEHHGWSDPIDSPWWWPTKYLFIGIHLCIYTYIYIICIYIYKYTYIYILWT